MQGETSPAIPATPRLLAARIRKTFFPNETFQTIPSKWSLPNIAFQMEFSKWNFPDGAVRVRSWRVGKPLPPAETLFFAQYFGDNAQFPKAVGALAKTYAQTPANALLHGMPHSAKIAAGDFPKSGKSP
ncbi:MAG: hypothetical protein DBX55_00320 [Verrucomicrobia bacterium]|nr:MAG: hypothetical protein DBX55_00320 [Verrucomicrobiota bacterium]